MRTTIGKTLLLGTFALLLIGCPGRRFDPFWKANRFRVLTVTSEPPELRPGQTATLDAVVYAPDAEGVDYEWEWCPFRTSGESNFECPMTQEELEDTLTENLPEDIPPELVTSLIADFDRGTEPTAQLPYPAPLPLIQGLCEALNQALEEQDDQLAGQIPSLDDCDEGYDISTRLVATAGDEEIVVGKRIKLWTGGDQEQNRNPDVTAIRIRPSEPGDYARLVDAGHGWVDQLEDDEDFYDVPADQPLPILVGVDYDLRAIVDAESLDTFAPRAPAGSDGDRLEPRLESVEYQWFTTVGSLSEDDGLYVPARNTLEEAAETTFRIPTTDTSQQFGGADGAAFVDSCPQLINDDPGDGCAITVWNVARDGRLGTGWIERTLLATGISE